MSGAVSVVRAAAGSATGRSGTAGFTEAFTAGVDVELGDDLIEPFEQGRATSTTL